MYKKSVFAAFACVAMATSAPVSASARESGKLSVRAVVPEVCGIQAGDFFVDEATNTIRGTVQEYCNGRGFQIFASHRSLDNDESADIVYDGMVTSMQPAGMTFVALRAGARFRYVPVVVRSRNINAALSLSFSIAAV